MVLNIGSNEKKKGKSAFVETLERFGVEHRRIPPRACTWQSDVEAFHKTIEEEFYDGEDYKDFLEFKAKAYAYEFYFNFKRKNRYKGWKTPVEILEENGGNISPQVFNLRAIILNNYLDNYIKSGYHVGSSDIL
jgi:hypothetical protein